MSHGEHGDVFYAKGDAARRAGPQPPIDRNSYARENGWAIASLAALYDVTGDKALLDAAIKAFDWMLANRRAPNGGFGHGRAANDDTHLGDTLAMAEAALALYRSTAGAALSRAGRRVRRGDRARSSRSGRRLHGAPARAGREGRARQAGEAGRRERGDDAPVQPAGPQHRPRGFPRGCRARHAQPDRARRGRPGRAGRAAGRPRAVARAGARHHRRRQGRSGGAGAVRRRAHLSDPLPAHRMARPPRGAAAGGRHRVPRDARGGRLRLRQRRLLGAGLQPRPRSHASSPRSTTARTVRSALLEESGIRGPSLQRHVPAPILRVARPSDDIDALLPFYREGLGLTVLYRFEDHDGFDGVMLGHEKAPWHFEFTRARGHTAGRAPTPDNLLVLYLPDAGEWQAAVERMRAPDSSRFRPSTPTGTARA